MGIEQNIKGYQKSWNQKPHHYQGQRVLGRENFANQQGIDWNYLREARLERVKQTMKKHDLSALLLTAGESIQYATGTSDNVWKASNGTRYALIFQDKDPVLFETIGPDTEIIKMYCPWIKPERIKPAITFKYTGAAYDSQVNRYIEQIKETLKENGIDSSYQIGVDTMDFGTYQSFKDAGVNVVGGGNALTEIRLIKLPEEIEAIKISSAITQAAFYNMKHKWIKPGVTEREVVGKVLDYYISNGMNSWGVIVASGSNTNPLHRYWSDKIIQQGDMVIVDVGVASYQGYGIDVTRCWPVEAEFTPEQKEVYKQCYESTYSAINAVKPGASTADVAMHFPQCAADDYKSTDLIQVGHSVGMGFYEGFWISRGFSTDHPMEIKKNMVLALETYVASPNGAAARLEDTVVVTEDGYELLSHVPFEKEALV
ncbi:Xaa-Pro peptidase family protein [Bacillus sp. JJ1521]|uniref:M24 family metallopeptidase n=1 Tax=Bacillus sp. JJ1521 TaxID=3122957 RepID=UPI002FFD7261